MWHHPSPWMLVFVAVDCKVSLLGIAGQASHLGSFTFPPGPDMGKITLKVSKITILDRAFLAHLLLNDCLGQKGDDFRIYSDFASNSILCRSVVILLCVCQLARIVCSFTDTWKRHWVTLLQHVQMCTQISIRNHCFLFIGISRLWE